MEIIDEYGVGYGVKTIPTLLDIAKPMFQKVYKDITQSEETNATPTAEELADKEQKELWAREDAIRKETQDREDNAYQRAVEDMRKAGVNPNLQSISGAQAGGGITTGTAKNLDRIENDKDRQLKLIMQEIENNFKGDQNDKDRLIKLITGLIPF